MLNLMVAGLLLAEGIVFGGVACFMFRKKSVRLAQYHRTWGNVIEVKERNGGGSVTRHAVVRYKTSTGKDATFESRFGSSNWKIKTGDRLEVLVNPNNPSDGEVVNFMALWGLPVILAVSSLASLVGAPVVYFLLRQ